MLEEDDFVCVVLKDNTTIEGFYKQEGSWFVLVEVVVDEETTKEFINKDCILRMSCSLVDKSLKDEIEKGEK